MTSHSTRFHLPRWFLGAAALVVASLSVRAGSTTITPWIPMFKGIDHAIGTNIPGGAALYPHLMVMHAIRVDLTDPDIKFLTNPKISGYEVGVRETAGYTVSQYLALNHVQIAINANYFTPAPVGTQTAGTPKVISGMLISDGVLVAPANSEHNATIQFDASNHPTVIHTNYPAHDTTGVRTAVTGTYPILINGVNMARAYLNSPDTIHDPQPRTAYGVSEDRKTLYLITVDGRQSGYSDNAYDWETAGWLQQLGAHDGENMDGGGSTTLVAQTSTGGNIELNKSSDVASGVGERTVGVVLGVFAKPLPGFFNNVTALADDDAATITWSTISPATTQLQYGLTTNFGSMTALGSALTTNHAVLLTNLYPNTTYYFQALATIGNTHYASSNLFFVTSNYVTTNVVIDVTNSWSYTTADLDGVNWTAPSYNDSAWSGPGPGILMADSRGPNPDIQPQGTIMALDTTTGFPFVTYYFRTHFQMANAGPGASFLLSGFVDDGAVAYLNGNEISRLRMDDPPAVISNQTLAAGFPCADQAPPAYGNAECLDDFPLPQNVGTNLVAGDNVMAVEVHNYNAQSPDITFGAIVTATQRAPVQPHLSFTNAPAGLQFSWTQGGFSLQQGPTIRGPWTNAPGQAFVSPYTAPTNASPSLFYRLSK